MPSNLVSWWNGRHGTLKMYCFGVWVRIPVKLLKKLAIKKGENIGNAKTESR